MACVYMPVDYRDLACLDNYIETSATISALISDTEAVQAIVAGDFNCQSHTHFYSALLNLVGDNSLVLTDTKRLSNAFTYGMN